MPHSNPEVTREKPETRLKVSGNPRPVIIVVDNELALLKTEVMLLGFFGFDVHTAQDYDEALQLLDRLSKTKGPKAPLAGLLVDCNLNGTSSAKRDGVRLIDEVRADKAMSGLPVVPFTRYVGNYRESLSQLGLSPVDRDEPLWLVCALERIRQASPRASTLPTVDPGQMNAILDEIIDNADCAKRHARLSVWQRVCQVIAVGLLASIWLWLAFDVVLIHPALSFLSLISCAGFSILVRREMTRCGTQAQ